MISQFLEQPSGVYLNPFPGPKLLGGLLGMIPVEPGFYGQAWADTILLTTNHGPTLAKIGQMTDLSLTVLAVDAGGFAPEAAIALDAVLPEQVDKALASVHGGALTQGGRILVPHILAARFGWEDGINVGAWTVRIVPGNLKKLSSFFEGDQASGTFTEKHLPAVLRRILIGLTLLSWQALLLAIPLLIFGWQALVKGLAALLLSMLVLALAWKILPGHAWLKGLVAGAVLALALALIPNPFVKISIYPAFGLLLSCFWMGLVFSGVKY